MLQTVSPALTTTQSHRVSSGKGESERGFRRTPRSARRNLPHLGVSSPYPVCRRTRPASTAHVEPGDLDREHPSPCSNVAFHRHLIRISRDMCISLRLCGRSPPILPFADIRITADYTGTRARRIWGVQTARRENKSLPDIRIPLVSHLQDLLFLLRWCYVLTLFPRPRHTLVFSFYRLSHISIPSVYARHEQNQHHSLLRVCGTCSLRMGHSCGTYPPSFCTWRASRTYRRRRQSSCKSSDAFGT